MSQLSFQDSKNPFLFAVYLGGKTEHSFIEVHDVCFVAAESIEEAYPSLKKKWFGIQKGLHIDCYWILEHMDGFSIELKKEAQSDATHKLYFVNLGGYDPEKFTELHENGFFVCASEEEAKSRAKSELLADVVQKHKDNLYDVDDCIMITSVGDYHIHLTKSNTVKENTKWVGYNVIGK